MKTAILIGDSIRMGYQDTVRAELNDIAELWVPTENGGNSDNVLSHLDDWLIARKPDLVHINCGLHDLKREFDQNANVIPLDRYSANVRTILTRLKKETDAIIIWALTTPVNEKWHHENKNFDRFEADVPAYNSAARQIATELDVPINDLYTAVQETGRDELLVSDGVHFKPEGYAVLGQTVAACIRQYLA